MHGLYYMYIYIYTQNYESLGGALQPADILSIKALPQSPFSQHTREPLRRQRRKTRSPLRVSEASQKKLPGGFPRQESLVFLVGKKNKLRRSAKWIHHQWPIDPQFFEPKTLFMLFFHSNIFMILPASPNGTATNGKQHLGPLEPKLHGSSETLDVSMGFIDVPTSGLWKVLWSFRNEITTARRAERLEILSSKHVHHMTSLHWHFYLFIGWYVHWSTQFIGSKSEFQNWESNFNLWSAKNENIMEHLDYRRMVFHVCLKQIFDQPGSHPQSLHSGSPNRFFFGARVANHRHPKVLGVEI